MARTKRTSKVMETAVTRSAALRSISPTLDLGSGLTIAAYDAAIGELKTTFDQYNTALSVVDEKYNTFPAKEKQVRDISERMLAGVASKYGKDSTEYEKAGGKRKSEKKRPVRKPAS